MKRGGQPAAEDVGGSLEARGGGAGEVGGDDVRGLEGKDKNSRRATDEGKGGGGGGVSFKEGEGKPMESTTKEEQADVLRCKMH